MSLSSLREAAGRASLLRRATAARGFATAATATLPWQKPTHDELPTPGVRKVTLLPGDGTRGVPDSRGATLTKNPQALARRSSKQRRRSSLQPARRCVALAALLAERSAGAPIEWESFAVSGLKGSPGYVTSVPKEVLDSITRNRACLKGAWRRLTAKHPPGAHALRLSDPTQPVQAACSPPSAAGCRR